MKSTPVMVSDPNGAVAQAFCLARRGCSTTSF